MSFDEVRPYTPGDEVRLIDWNVSARTGEVFVKRFVEERELTVLIVADASASMDFGLSAAEYRTLTGSARIEDTKRDLAALVAGAIALSAQMNNDRVGLVTFGAKVDRFIPPRKGRQHALRIIREVLAMEATGAPSRLDEALSFVGRVMKRRAAVFVISDFEVPPFERALRVATRRHDVHGLCVRDPNEERLAPGGLRAFRDAETGEVEVVHVTRAFAERFAEAARRHVAGVEQVLKRNRVAYTRFDTDRPYDRALAGHFARLKGKAL